MNKNKVLQIFAKNNISIANNGAGLAWFCSTCGRRISWNPKDMNIIGNYIDNDSMADLFEALSWFLRNPDQREM